MRIGVAVLIQHEGTKGTKDHEATHPPICFLGGGGASCTFVSFVPSC
jgi:hypothetical protein